MVLWCVPLTRIISHICVNSQPSNVKGVNHVGVPLLSVAGVMKDII